MADIWVLTQPTDGSKKRGFIRADVITSVSGDTDGVLAVRSDTQDLVGSVDEKRQRLSVSSGSTR